MKLLGWIISSLLVFLFLLIILLNVPQVQSIVKDAAVKYLNKKLHTTVQLQNLSLHIPSSISLDKLYMEDQSGDTLVYSGHLFVKIDMLGLLSGSVHIDSVQLDDFSANVYRKLPDTTFNFEYILDAFGTGSDTTSSESSGSTGSFYIGAIDLSHVRLHYDDDVTGYKALADIGKFSTHFSDFNLDKMRFMPDSIKLSKVYASFIRKKPLVEPMIDSSQTNEETQMPDINFKDLSLNKVVLHYNDSVEGMSGDADLGVFQLIPQKIDLENQNVQLKKLVFDHSALSFSTEAPSEKVVVDTSGSTHKDTLSASDHWTLALDTLQMLKNHFKYDDNGKPHQKAGIDYNHLDITDFNLLVSSLFYSTDSSSASINGIALKEHSGFVLRKLKANAIYTNHGAILKHLLLQTANSQVENYIAIYYPSLDTLSIDPGALGITANLDSGQLDLNDVYYFQPDLASNEYLKGLAKHNIRFHGKISGKLNNLSVDSLNIRAANQTSLSLNAQLEGLPDMNKSVFDIKLQNFITGRKDLQEILPASLLPTSVRLPQKLDLSGNFKGSVNTFQTKLQLKSSDGNVALRSRVQNIQDTIHARYSGNLESDRLQLGHLLKDDSLYGPVSLSASFRGSGLTINSLNAELKGGVKQAKLKGYNYQNLNFSGALANGKGQLKAEMMDSAIAFNLQAQTDLSHAKPALKLNLDLSKANLYTLHFSEDSLLLKGKITADFDTLDVDSPNGKLALRNLEVEMPGKNIQVDSVTLTAFPSDSGRQIKLKSPFANAAIYGHYHLSQTGQVVSYLMQKYKGVDSTGLLPKDSLPNWNMKWNLNLLSTPLWQQMAPELQSFGGASFEGQIALSPDSLQMKGAVAPFEYNDISTDSIHLLVREQSDKLRYALFGANINSSSLNIPQIHLTGALDSSKLSVNMKILDKKREEKYHLSGNMKRNKDQYRFSLLPDSLLLNYEKWEVPAGNYILYGPKQLFAHNVKLENAGQSLSIHSDSSQGKDNLGLTFHHFRLTTLTHMVLSDSLDIAGIINGNAAATHLFDTLRLAADLKMDSVVVNQHPVGAVQMNVNNKIKGAYSANLKWTGNGNDINISGKYFTEVPGHFDVDINIPALPLTTIQALSLGQIKDAQGKLTGDIKLSGTTDAPQVNGKLAFKDAGANITQINSFFKIPDDAITFDDNGIHFDQFNLLDSAGNKALIDGDILTRKYQHFRFNLNVKARHYRIFNAPKEKDAIAYGQLYINTNTQIRGDENLPKVNMDLSVDKKSDLTIVMPEENPQKVSSEGVVEFINPKQLKDTAAVQKISSDSLRQTLKGIQLSANVSVDTSAELSLIIDPVNGDNLKVQGQANLNFTIDPSGKMSLTGRYNIINGLYNLSLEGLIKRKFTIEKGSSITWTGDPTSANLDITAKYEVKASALDLVQDQLSDKSEITKNTYKQQLPFDVLLNLKGELMQPDISFQLDMPQEAQQAFDGAVYTRIKQINTNPSEVNKQTLGLLVLGHFIADNPFQTASGGGGAEQMVRQSASKILSQQLNRLAGDLVKGVNINFDLQSSQDYSTGKAENQTNLNVGLSKSLFNDRTTVYVGSNIPLQGNNNNQKASQIVGDVAVEYKLSRDGRYRLRAYRKNKYEGVIEGQFVETGLSFIIVMDYNKFKELFQKPKHGRRR